MLPAIRSSSEVYGESRDPLEGVPVAGILGDQQAALFGQACFERGEAKNTYGTGSFVLMNIGAVPVRSKAGLITTLAYRLGDAPPVYALEGSIAVTGALVQWLRDNLGILKDSADVETLARTVEDNGDVYFVPAFSGLYAPHWREDARGVICGLTRFARKGHIARAALEAAAYQTRDVLVAMEKDSKIPIRELRADGGMVANDLLMQFQADILDVPVVRPVVTETTALGAAYAAGLAVGYWKSTAELAENWAVDHRWQPKMEPKARKALTAFLGQGSGALAGLDGRTEALHEGFNPAYTNEAYDYARASNGVRAAGMNAHGSHLGCYGSRCPRRSGGRRGGVAFGQENRRHGRRRWRAVTPVAAMAAPDRPDGRGQLARIC